MKKYNSILVLSLLSLTLVGCNGKTPITDLKEKVEKRKHSVVGQVDPIPQFKEGDSYYYQNVNLRSPFDYTAMESKKTDDKVFTDVKPDERRTKEPLEDVDIDRIKMVGTMRKGNGALEAIIDHGTGDYKIVGVGGYMGRNNGRITSITLDTIEMTEIIPNGSFRWLERPLIIKLTTK
jgi:type IV pilus assembly protein PilP